MAGGGARLKARKRDPEGEEDRGREKEEQSLDKPPGFELLSMSAAQKNKSQGGDWVNPSVL